MSDSIENFVAKLQADGVQAGQAKADEIIAGAEKKAQSIIDDANEKAKKIVADANDEAVASLARSKSDLELAARDTVSKLQEALCNCLNGLLQSASETQLEDVAFLGHVLKEIIDQYVKADLHAKTIIKINVQPETLKQLKDWAIKTVGEEIVENVRPMLDIKSKLNQAGFEYTVKNGTVEVTRDSVTQLLSQLVTPSLREVLTTAVKSSGAEEK